MKPTEAQTPEELVESQAEALGHYAVDDGFCACGALCETGTRFRAHLERVLKLEAEKGERHV